MGCGASKHQSSAVTPLLRRRLSLGELGPDEGGTEEDVTEEDRSLLMTITQQEIFDFVKANDGRKYSVGSQTDKAGNQADSFSSKTTKLDGKPFDSSSECIGYACKKGLKPEAPNQDSFLIMKIENEYALYGVFDGHGRKGHDISNFVKDNLPKILFSQESFSSNPEEALLKTFAKTQYLIEKATALRTIDATRSGTTCSVVLHCIEKKTLYVAHVGDSRVVLGKQVQDAKEKKWTHVELTVDHKPDLPEERARIEKNGGIVVFDGGWNYRVFAKGKKDSRGKRYPGLNMSRAMGDLSGFNDAGISCVPDVNQHFMSVQPTAQPTKPQPAAIDDEPSNTEPARSPSLQSSTPTVSSYDIDKQDKFILLCSDGVWEFISSQVAVNEVSAFPPEESDKAAEHLAYLAWQSWMREMDGMVVDDITALVVHLNK
jgi:serine/threonine protein phosphatase PrpC|mmetsp:Transcript_25625/g.41094  ORF Transcript_25625/g.41094 Transcript_25625/m.41094 type:complete len:430 (-) Transcript_25625:87-1376(-)